MEETYFPQVATPEFAPATFQAAVTAGLAVFALVLYRRSPQRWFAWWAAAWALYLVRLAAIFAYLRTGELVWLFWHQVVTGWVALTILWAALVFSRDARWKSWYAILPLFPMILAWVAIHALDRFMLVAVPMVVLIAGATLWTGWVFWRHANTNRSHGARFVAVTFILWGLHHLDYPFLRARNATQAWEYYLDIGFELAVGVGFGVLVLSELATRLATRTNDLARLSASMVQQHEAERRRLSRDLHDETAQTLSAVKLEIGMLREGADDTVRAHLDRVLAQVDGGIRGIRRVMNDLRPALLDDLGLIPAIRSLADDVRERSELDVQTDLSESVPQLSTDAELAIFRAAQESLANVVRHASASRVILQLSSDAARVRLLVRDDGTGLPTAATGPDGSGEHHLGLAGMRERIAGLGGTVEVSNAHGGGVTVLVEVPVSVETRMAGGMA